MAVNSAGQTVASADGCQGHTYPFAVPTGSYALTNGQGYVGGATVTAGQQTQADVVCNVPLPAHPRIEVPPAGFEPATQRP